MRKTRVCGATKLFTPVSGLTIGRCDRARLHEDEHVDTDKDLRWGSDDANNAR